jgi:hypothetical protein
MLGAIPALSNTPSWHDAKLSTGKTLPFYPLYSHFYIVSVSTFRSANVTLLIADLTPLCTKTPFPTS